MRHHVLAISGSLRAQSDNTRLLHAAAGLLPAGTVLTVWTGLKHIPPFDEDDEHRTPHIAVVALRQALRAADAVLIATPEYNSSVPGQLKNALDWVSRPRESAALRGKPTAVIGASPSAFGAAWAQAEARKVLAAMGADVLEHEFSVPGSDEAFEPTGALRDPVLARRLAGVLEALVATSRATRSAA